MWAIEHVQSCLLHDGVVARYSRYHLNQMTNDRAILFLYFRILELELLILLCCCGGLVDGRRVHASTLRGCGLFPGCCQEANFHLETLLENWPSSHWHHDANDSSSMLHAFETMSW